MPIERARTTRRSEEHTSELQSPCNLVCRLLLEKKKKKKHQTKTYIINYISIFSFVLLHLYLSFFFFFFNDTATTEIYTLSLHDALPICGRARGPAISQTRSRPGSVGSFDGLDDAARQLTECR